MFKNILKAISKLNNQQENFNPGVFNDPVALKTDWRPLVRGGTNFRTHKLVTVDATQMEFETTLTTKIFYTIFMAIGASSATFIPYFILKGKEIGSFNLYIDGLMNGNYIAETFAPIVFGLIFFTVGIFMYNSLEKLILFDRTTNKFIKGSEEISLTDIHAMQIISEYVRSDKNSYYSYELNLVLKNGDRVNVVDHGSYKHLVKDASELSNTLGIKIWDSCNTPAFSKSA